MFKEIFSHLDMQHLGETGMVMFFAIFIAVAIYAVTRKRKELDYWANLPLASIEAEKEVSKS